MVVPNSIPALFLARYHRHNSLNHGLPPVTTGEVVSLASQLSLPAAARAGYAILRDRASGHSNRAARSIWEQARRRAIDSLALCTKAMLYDAMNRESEQERVGLHGGACALRALRSSHSCAAGKRVSPGTIAARLIDFHFGSNPGACSRSIRENR